MRSIAPAHIGATWLDYPDNSSLAVEVFMQGCSHNCVGCQNRELQLWEGKKQIPTTAIFTQIENACKKYATNKVVFVGGEPLLELNGNLAFIKVFLSEYKHVYDICIYTGYSKEYCLDKEIAGFTYLKTGKYIESKNVEMYKTDEAIQFASINQELYNKDYILLSEKGKVNFKEI